MVTPAGGLGLLSPLYAGAVALRRSLYDAGWLRIVRLPVPVISVGNLTAGGSGKSPMVAHIARDLDRKGRRPAVVSRGYRGGHRGRATIVSDGGGGGPLVGADVAGDEPVMLARLLPGVPVVVSRRRSDGGTIAVERLGAGCIILDDGFQHRSLARDLDLLLLDAERPFGNGRLLPAGLLREPITAMARADALIVTGADPRGDDETLRVAAHRHNPGAPILRCRARSTGLVERDGVTALPLERLRGARTACFAGIANPDRFFRQALEAGAEVVASLPFPDHHVFTTEDLERVRDTAARAGAELLLTTEKDLARLAGNDTAPALPEPLLALRQEVEVEEAKAFTTLLDGVFG